VPRILLDISRLCYRRLAGRLPTGIDRVALEYLRHYAEGARAVLTRGPFNSVLSSADSARAFEWLLDPGGAGGVFPALRLPGSAFLGWCAMPDVADSVLINAGHSGLEYAGYAASLRQRGARPAIFVHDLIPISHPEYFPAGEQTRHVARMRTALAVGQGVVVNSQYTLDTLRRFAEDEGLRVPHAVVAPLASSLPRVMPGPRPVAAPYFVVVGTIEPRKNHAMLLQLWRSLVNRQDLQDLQDSKPGIQNTSHNTQAPPHPSHLTPHPGKSDAIPRLVVIGQRGHESENVVDLLERCRQLEGVVIELGRCSDTELATYLHHAQALLYPTFIEGYGIPVVEALALGTPVIASDLAVFREVAGEIPEYAGPLDGKRWLELIADYARPDSARRAAQLDRMKGYRAPTWEQHFEKVDEFLQGLGNRQDSQRTFYRTR
jgi:glycosyltransferase involved in cell wall biosynthesis